MFPGVWHANAEIQIHEYTNRVKVYLRVLHLGLSGTLSYAIFVYLCICIFVFAFLIHGNIIFEILEQPSRKKGLRENWTVYWVLYDIKSKILTQVKRERCKKVFHHWWILLHTYISSFFVGWGGMRTSALCIFVNGELCVGFLELSLSFYGRLNISDRFTFHFIASKYFR